MAVAQERRKVVIARLSSVSSTAGIGFPVGCAFSVSPNVTTGVGRQDMIVRDLNKKAWHGNFNLHQVHRGRVPPEIRPDRGLVCRVLYLSERRGEGIYGRAAMRDSRSSYPKEFRAIRRW